jgi:hypothetical protein
MQTMMALEKSFDAVLKAPIFGSYGEKLVVCRYAFWLRVWLAATGFFP